VAADTAVAISQLEGITCTGLPQGKHFVINSDVDADAFQKELQEGSECDIEAIKKAVDFSKQTLVAALVTGSGCSHELSREARMDGDTLAITLTYTQIGTCEPFFMLPELVVVDKVADASKIRVERKQVTKSDD
jgi:hypothetical protein